MCSGSRSQKVKALTKSIYIDKQLTYAIVPKPVKYYSPESEGSREVANLTERKNLHTPIYGVKEFVCLSVCLLQTLTPIILHHSQLGLYLSTLFTMFASSENGEMGLFRCIDRVRLKTSL